MKKLSLALAVVLLVISLAPISFAYCTHGTYTPPSPAYMGDHHIHTIYVYRRCDDCNAIIGVDSTSGSYTCYHSYSYHSTSYKQMNASRHQKIVKETLHCTCGCDNPGYRNTTSGELHASGSGYTSDSCNGITHSFYKTCTKCGSSFLAGTAPCDGINHPDNAINKVPHYEFIM